MKYPLNRMFEENREDVSKVYDFHLLTGHFMELDTPPHELIAKTIYEGELFHTESKTKKGDEKIAAQINSIIKYLTALALKEKCLVTDAEGLFSFVCVRRPDLDLDWTTLRKLISHSTGKVQDYSEQKTLELATTLYLSAIKNALNEQYEEK